MDDEAFEAGFYGEAFARFEVWGEDSVSRLLSSGDIVHQDREAALVWLGRKSRESASAREAIDKENTAIANAAKDAALRLTREARRANNIATLALVMSIISIAATIFVAHK